ncbi:MAG: collagen-like protein [Planctomycetaceae bacterium]|jgi:hypothetical protein|nr:collagen-like protein [Planctomycetaceae bacterium]
MASENAITGFAALLERLTSLINEKTPGADGKSAYEIWLEAGNSGSEADFLLSLQGEPGPQGIQGEKGENGTDGTDGEQGIQGIQGLTGDKGDKGDTGEPGPQGEKGDDGENGDTGITWNIIN